MNRYQDTDSPLILAHRGGAGEAPENTLKAFRHAVDLGFNYLETDVRSTVDGILYLCHSAQSVLPNRPLRLKSNPHPLMLRELFIAFPDCYFALDPKHYRAVEPLAKLIVEYGLERRVCIGSSFDKRTERTASLIEQQTGTRPCTALVSAKAITKLLLNSKHTRGKKNGIQASFIHVPARLIKQTTVQAAHNTNLKIIAWVLNDEDSMYNALALGVDGFMTDYPSIARKVIRKA